MGLFDRLKRVVGANLNDLVSKAEDPEKMLEQALLEMQEDMVKLRQGTAQAIASQKRTEKQYQDAVNEVNKWQRNAQLAIQKGDESLARQALERKKTYNDTNYSKDWLRLVNKIIISGRQTKLEISKTNQSKIGVNAHNNKF